MSTIGVDGIERVQRLVEERRPDMMKMSRWFAN